MHVYRSPGFRPVTAPDPNTAACTFAKRLAWRFFRKEGGVVRLELVPGSSGDVGTVWTYSAEIGKDHRQGDLFSHRHEIEVTLDE